MAFNFFLRRASSSILPLGIRSAGGVISAMFNVEKRHLVGSKFLPFSRFSTITDDCVLHLIDYGDSAQKSSNMMIHIPDDFPFEIEENKEYLIDCFKRYLFRRKYQDEIIEVAANGYEVVDDKPSILMNAYVLRGSQKLLFEMTAEPNQINIHTCTMEDTATRHLKAFQNYLEIRGFNSSTINFLYNCIWKPNPGCDTFHVIDYDYTAQQSSNVPNGFPFEIQDSSKCGYRVVLFLKREFEDEIIEAKVVYSTYGGQIHYPLAFVMSVKIVHRDAHIDLHVDVTPQDPDPVHIYRMSMRAPSGHLKAFQKFWETRGIKPSTTNFFFDYFKKKGELLPLDTGVDTD